MEYIYYMSTYLILLNIVTTYRLLKAEDYEVTQKTIQFILLWTIPFLGVLIVTFFLNQEPIILSEKMQKYKIILKVLLFPWLIKIKSNENKDIGNSDAGYQSDFALTSGGD
ncbi:hypothetical protein MNB_SM-4-387 [hydrothermal vent metagenome]|uniref:Uncharacterized protein n=1 Tax=hydrothermal vent metagenome TaxID=652676 RepID=A0A1W1BJE6_9ZZZZ